MRKAAFTAIMLALMLAVTLGFMEVAVRLIFPQPELYPRFRYSERYGHLWPASATIVNRLPGAWHFVYRTNEYGYRVSMPEISNRYDRPNVVVLGDSFTFGVGVNDGDEYPAVLAERLAGQADIVNLGIGGFGLTQEIRSFYEFGILFQPAVVVLQFSGNDPDDNFYSRVATVENGRFRFHRDRSLGGAFSGVKDWLSGSLLQRSALYNLARNRAYLYWERRIVTDASAGDQQGKESFYNELLSTFADDLHRRGIRLLVIGVQGQLAAWPRIEGRVEALDREGLLRYLRTEQWFTGLSGYESPEGHPWGKKGHRIVAEHLVDPVRAALQAGQGAQTAACARLLR